MEFVQLNVNVPVSCLIGFVGLMQLSVERLSSMKKYVFGFGSAQVCETSSLHLGQLLSGAYVPLISA